MTLQIHSSEWSGPFSPRAAFAVTQGETELILGGWSGAQPSLGEESVISTPHGTAERTLPSPVQKSTCG